MEFAPYWPILLIAVGLSVWLLFRSRNDFRMSVRPEGIEFRGKLPGSCLGTIQEFFQREFPGRAGIVVLGSGGFGRRLKLGFHGALTVGEQQRIRNFLIDLFE